MSPSCSRKLAQGGLAMLDPADTAATRTIMNAGNSAMNR